DFSAPEAVVVKNRAGILRLHNFFQRGKLWGIVPVDLDRDQPGNGKALQHVGFSDPWLDKLERLLAAKRSDFQDAILIGKEFRDLGDLRIARIATAALNLDGDLRRNLVRPHAGRVEDDINAARRERGEESHNRNHKRQRTPCDRPWRNDGRVAACEFRGALPNRLDWNR